ncbi:protein FAM47E [Aplochiton taeniatus]
MKNAALDRGPKKRFSKEQACYSKPIILQQVHREHVAAVEQKLKQHPLALFPHLEQGMPPELFDEVISVLDPNMCVSRTSTGSSPEKQQCAEEANIEDESDSFEIKEEEVIDSEEIKPLTKNPYKGLQVRDCSAEEQDQTVSVKQLRSPSQDEDIKKVTKLFCDWVTSLGGETNNLSESTILGLFVSGFEKKPSLTFPIQVVDTSHVPEELRNSVEDLRKDYSQHALLKDSEPYKSKPGTKKSHYGEWYLDPKSWKKRDPDEPLWDPNAIPEDLEFFKEISEKDEELRQIHATQAFKQFIISKGLRVPRFLSSLFVDEEPEHQTRGRPDGIGSGSTRKGTVVY